MTLETDEDVEQLKHSGLIFADLGPNRLEVTVSGSTNAFIKRLSAVSVESLDVSSLDLEEVFMHYYGQEAK